MRTAGWAWGWSLLRLAMAAAIAAAIVAQLVRSVGTAIELGRDVGMTIANFFSFFTILSNAATALVLAWAALWWFTRGRRADAATAAEPAALALALASVTTYMLITGVVYNTLLRSVELPQGSEPIPWSNEILHLIGPIFMLADLLVGPLRRAMPWQAVLGILAFPILWIVYTLVRGPLVTNPVSGNPWWYPYPFLDPTNSGLQPVSGYAGVAIYIVAIAVGIIIVASIVVWVGRLRGTVPADPAAGADEAAPLSQTTAPAADRDR